MPTHSCNPTSISRRTLITRRLPSGCGAVAGKSRSRVVQTRAARTPSTRPDIQILRSPQKHDVVIIGSGASGGMAAWNLTRKGIGVLMLDAGVKFDRSKFWSHVKTWEVEDKLERGQRPPQFYVDLKGQPYSTVKDQAFALVRVWRR